MEVRLLGAIEAAADGVVPPLGGPKQRAVLADLALHAAQVVPTVQLIDDLWGERPPASAKATLETYISRLRQVLNVWRGPLLVTRPPGYMLDAAPDVDVAFRDLAARGEGARQGDADGGALVGSALALWRGPALADVRGPFAVRAGQRLEDERLTAEKSWSMRGCGRGTTGRSCRNLKCSSQDHRTGSASARSSCWRCIARDDRPRRWPLPPRPRTADWRSWHRTWAGATRTPARDPAQAPELEPAGAGASGPPRPRPPGSRPTG